MEGIRAPPAEPMDGDQARLLSDEAVVENLQRGEAVQNDVQQALASLASALSSVSDHAGIIRTVKRRFDERQEACANLARATEEARVEQENREQLNQAQSERESSLRHEVDRLERAVKTAQEERETAQREAEVAASTAVKEATRLREKADSAQSEAAEWQRKANAGESRIESMTEEVGALHEAMAGLHGEMGAVQRELDGAKAAQDKLAADLSRAEGRHRKSQEACSATLSRAKDAEKQLRAETGERERVSAELAKLLEVSEQGEAEKEALTTEVKRLKESEGLHLSSSEKLNTTNRELNALLQRLSAELEDAKAAAESNSKRSEALVLEAGLKEEEGRRVKENLAAAESRLSTAEREKTFLKEAVSKSSAEAHAKTAELDRQRGELDLLEREKHDLVLDVQERVRAQEEAAADAERYRQRVEEVEKRLKEGESAKLAAERSKNKTLDELSDARRGTAMQDERIEALRSELATLKRTLEQTIEAAKSRDRESAQRLVQLSQANAKLSSEGTSARARVVDAEEAAEKARHDLEDATKALTRSEETGRRAAETVQRLEEELEVADARWKAAQGQLANATRREKRSAEEARQQLREALESKNKEVDAALREAETNAQRRSAEAEASQRAAERNHERALAAVREEAKKQLAAEEAKRVREVSEARRKSKAVVEALQTLQGELRNSEAKGSGLERQVSQLSARMNRVGSSSVGAGGGGGGDGGDGSAAGSGGVAREGGHGGGGGGSKARGAEVTEAEIASLRRQMKAATQAKETAQRSALEAQSRAEEEAKRRSSVEESLCRKESEMLATLERLNVLKVRQQEVEEGAREAEEDLRGLVRQRESEIENLTRRNQVLNDALTRLTSSEPYPGDVGIAGSRSAMSAASAGRGANGFPEIPRLMDGGRELAASLGDSWQTASTSSFSPKFGGPAGNSQIGLEASLSVLADGSAGFEPPAPPTVETEVGYSPHHHADRHVGTHHDVDGGNASHGHRHHGSNRQTAGSDGDGLRGGGGEGAPASGGGFCEHRLEGGEAQGRVEGGGTEWKGGCDGDDGDLRGSFHQRRTDVPGASGSIHPDESHHSRNEYAVPAAAAETSHDRNGKSAPMVSTNDSNGRRATGLLHGVSAAMASGALPAAARPKPNTTLTPNQDRPSAGGDQTERAYRGDESTSNHFPRVEGSDYGDGGGRRVDGEGLYQARATSARDDAGGGMERGGMSSARGGMDGDIGNDQDQGLMGHWRRDAMGEQARRHIDEALRERALRRRNSDGEALAFPARQSSSRRARSGSISSTTTNASLAFPAPGRSEFRTSASSSNILGDAGDGARFINLGAIAQRAGGGSSSKQGLPGRVGGAGRVAARSAAGAAKKTAVARAYGIPQTNR